MRMKSEELEISTLELKTSTQLLKTERQQFIVRYVNRYGRALNTVLCKILQVSHDTIRRDLAALAEQNLLVQVHGGALPVKNDLLYPDISPSQIIAKKIALLLRNDSFILSCGGDALLALFELIPSDFTATLLTTSMPIASKYSEHKSMEVIQIGDRVQKNTKLTAGGEAITKIRQVRADMCILEATAIDANYGLTENNGEIAQVKNTMAERSVITVCLATADAIGKVAAIQACTPQQLTYLITDLNCNHPSLETYRTAGILVR